jgi:hypothetical protein
VSGTSVIEFATRTKGRGFKSLPSCMVLGLKSKLIRIFIEWFLGKLILNFLSKTATGRGTVIQQKRENKRNK